MSRDAKIAGRLGVEFPPLLRAGTITDAMVRTVRERGVGWVCAHCVKFWWGVERGHAQCEALFKRTPCGGPMAELAFPEYEGPIPRETFPTFCFVCGEASSGAVRIHGIEEMIGVCAAHEDFVYTMRPRDPREKCEIIMKVKTEVSS